MARAGFVVPSDLFDGDLDNYSDEELGRIFRAMFKIVNGVQVELSREENRIIREWRRLDEVASRRYTASVENGKKGGRPKTEENPTKPNKTQQNPTEPNDNQTITYENHIKDKYKDKSKDNTKGNSKDNSNNIRGFKKPTVEEIKTYCMERQNGIDPEMFYDFYEARAWQLTKGRKVADWKACVRTWEKRMQERHITTMPRKKMLSDIEERKNDWEQIKANIPDPLEMVE